VVCDAVTLRECLPTFRRKHTGSYSKRKESYEIYLLYVKTDKNSMCIFSTDANKISSMAYNKVQRSTENLHCLLSRPSFIQSFSFLFIHSFTELLFLRLIKHHAIKYSDLAFQRLISVCINIKHAKHNSRSQWPSGLRRGSAADRLLALRFRIPPWAWMLALCVSYSKGPKAKPGQFG
jgi:hypothetical protein